MANEHLDSTKNLTDNRQGISSERLNFILALCAIFISAASFYATYLQANAAERQVKAMTLPLIQFTHGNWQETTQTESLSFILKNAGIGPAIIKNITLKYQGNHYTNWNSFYLACCLEKNTREKQTINAITNPTVNAILAGQSEFQFITIDKSNNDKMFWSKLNQARHQLSLNICYCSLLDECYMTEKNGVIEAVDYCPVE